MLSTTTPSLSVHSLRRLAAVLTCLSGLWQVAGLWLAPLTAQTVLDALCGSVYLLIAVGLAGQSRFALWLAIAVTACMLWFNFTGEPPLERPALIRAAVDALIILLSIRVLWLLRHQPSI